MTGDLDPYAIAWHEAGHACALHHFGLPVREIIAFGDYDAAVRAGRTGRVITHAASVPDPMARAVCLLAGPVAEKLLIGSDEAWRHRGGDMARARLALDGRDDRLQFAKGVACSLVREERERIEDVAHALLRQLLDPLQGAQYARLDGRQFLRVLRG
jgi:hypothetical protein